MKTFLKSLGLAMMVWGGVTIAFHLAGIVSKRSEWLNNWGATTGWVIKCGIVATGAILFFAIKGKSKNEKIPNR